MLASDVPAPPAGVRTRAALALELALVFAVALATLLAASRTFGLTWDEATYFRYADSIRVWWRAGAPTDAASLARYWAYDVYSNPHPPFLRILAALGSSVVERWLPFPTDYRFAHFAWIGGCLAGVYGLLRRRWSALASATAVVFAALQPRVFGHLLIASSDSPVALAWLLLALLAWRLADGEPAATGDGRRRAHRAALWWAFFLVAGCAAASKFTGFLALLPIGAFFVWRRRWRDAALVAAAAAWALLFVVIVSPHVWHHPLAGLLSYLRYPLQRQATPFSTPYFGKLYRNDLPWHYFLVMSAITMPPLVLVLMPVAALARGELRKLLAPVAFALGFWLLLVHLPNTPRHDEVRQFVSVYPLLGIVAWAGLLAGIERLRRASPRWVSPRLAPIACGVAMVLLAATVVRAHPFELSSYNGFIGGVRGAERAGMEMSLYFEAVDRGVLRALERYPRPGETLFMSPFWPPLFETYVQHDALHSPLVLLPQYPREHPDWLLLVRRRYLYNDSLFLALPAAYEVRYDGVPLVKLVRTADVPSRPASSPPPSP
ncbi:MAG TPA: hypothetical protein VGS57_19465 [Thermoanaerobaculia bacterium]|nr:hypothetical protein [Thermoanaerobaculia bacterium]